jgi:hypothetical protein
MRCFVPVPVSRKSVPHVATVDAMPEMQYLHLAHLPGARECKSLARIVRKLCWLRLRAHPSRTCRRVNRRFAILRRSASSLARPSHGEHPESLDGIGTACCRRQCEVECRAASLVHCCPNTPAVRLNDRLADRQPHTATLRLRCKESLE